MKKIMNQPENFIGEMLEGLYLARRAAKDVQGGRTVYGR